MEGMQAYGAGKAGGAFDPITFFQQPQTIIRIVSWVSQEVCVLFWESWWTHLSHLFLSSIRYLFRGTGYFYKKKNKQTKKHKPADISVKMKDKKID